MDDEDLQPHCAADGNIKPLLNKNTSPCIFYAFISWHSLLVPGGDKKHKRLLYAYVWTY